MGLLSLTAYLKFWGWVYLIVTLAIALFKREAIFLSHPGERLASGRGSNAGAP